MRVQRWDDPDLDLEKHAREVVRGAAELSDQARAQMIAAIGREPSTTASARTIARAYLAARGIAA
jgi:hypothetical protein